MIWDIGIHSVFNSPADNMSERRKWAIIPLYMYTVSYQVSDVRIPGNDLWNLRILHIITCCFGWSLISFLLNGSKISIKTLVLICIFIWIIGLIIFSYHFAPNNWLGMGSFILILFPWSLFNCVHLIHVNELVYSGTGGRDIVHQMERNSSIPNFVDLIM